MLHFSSKLQKSTALSSGEAELSAQVGGLTDGLGIKNLFREFGLTLSLRSCVVIPVRRALYFWFGNWQVKALGAQAPLGTGSGGTWRS